MISQGFVIASIIMLLATALLHSIMGEKLLISPLLRLKGNRVLESNLARMLLRFCWHLISLMWIVLAIGLYSVTFKPQSASVLILLSTGWCFLAIGIFDLIFSKGRHMGWPFLTLIGVFSLMAVYL